MVQFQVIRVTNFFSTSKLTKQVESQLNKLNSDGFEIISVSFGYNAWLIPTAFITVKKETQH